VTTILGYARVSTLGQDLDAQLASLAAEGVESGHVFTDKLSGAVNVERSGLTALRYYAREGHTVVVTAIDGLGRSVAEVTRTIANLVERQILCELYLKEWTPVRPPAGRSPPSWRPWPNSSLNLAASDAPPPVNPDGPANCRPRSPQSSAGTAKINFAGWRQPENPLASWPRPWGSVELPPTGT